MRLPYIDSANNSELTTVSQFAGLNKNLITQANEFSDMYNASSRLYPAICNRLPRGIASQNVAKPHGMLYKNGMFYIDGTQAFYNGAVVGAVTDTDKQLCGMGAYIVILPDKKVYNTSSNTLESMEVTFTPTTQVKFTPFSEGSAFTTITCTGIGKQFKQYDAVTIEGCTNNDLNATKIINEIADDYIVVTFALETAFNQTGGITFKRTVPDMDYICESDNRIWGCSSANHEIYASKLGDPLNWNCFESIATDSYAVTVGSDGDFTGCISHLGNVLFFKENTIHKMYGSKPSAFQLNTYTLPGVKKGCSKSLQIVNETLYYVGRDNVYSFDGSTPNPIGSNLKGLNIEQAVSGLSDAKLYISSQINNKQTLMVYDPQIGIWDIEDETKFKFATYGEGVLYYIDANNDMRTIAGADTSTIRWMLESGDQIENTLLNKYVEKLLFNFWLDRGSKVEIYLKYDDAPLWNRVGTIDSEWNKTYVLPIVPRRCSKWRYKLEGRGPYKLLGIGKYTEGTTEMNNGDYRPQFN